LANLSFDRAAQSIQSEAKGGGIEQAGGNFVPQAPQNHADGIRHGRETMDVRERGSARRPKEFIHGREVAKKSRFCRAFHFPDYPMNERFADVYRV
jgi:hypothetical protein